jgi:hypothetical protein
MFNFVLFFFSNPHHSRMSFGIQHLKGLLHKRNFLSKLTIWKFYKGGIVVYLTSLCVNWAFFGMSGSV